MSEKISKISLACEHISKIIKNRHKKQISKISLACERENKPESSECE